MVITTLVSGMTASWGCRDVELESQEMLGDGEGSKPCLQVFLTSFPTLAAPGVASNMVPLFRTGRVFPGISGINWSHDYEEPETVEVGTSFTIFRGKKSGDQGKLSCTTVSLSALPSSGSPATLGLVEGVRDLTIKLIGHFLLVPSRWAGVPVFNLMSLLFCGIGQGRLDPGVVVTIFRALREFSVSPGQFFQYLFWAMWLLPSPMPGG